MKALVIALIVLVVLLLVVLVNMYQMRRNKQIFTKQPNIVYYSGLITAPAQAQSSDGSAIYLGTTTNEGGCASSCEDQSWCTGYSWTAPGTAANGYDNQCYGMKSIASRTAQTGTNSGYKPEPFCSKLMQRYGMCNAGERDGASGGSPAPAKKQAFTNQGMDPTLGTLWAGYMQPSVLPIGGFH